MAFSSVQTSSGWHVMQMWHHLDSTTKTEMEKLKAMVELDSVLKVISLQNAQ